MFLLRPISEMKAGNAALRTVLRGDAAGVMCEANEGCISSTLCHIPEWGNPQIPACDSLYDL
jgi:hypothetical protein